MAETSSDCSPPQQQQQQQQPHHHHHRQQQQLLLHQQAQPKPPSPQVISTPNPSGQISGNCIEYANETELMKEFSTYMGDPKNVETATSYLFQSLLDETILGVVFEVHHSLKTGTTDAVEGQPEDSQQFNIVDSPDFDVFGSSTAKKAMDCTCPNCDRLVAASRFAPHLEKCMGMGRNSSRIASRRIANAREGSNYFGSAISDDEDDVDWSGEKRRKKLQAVRTNGSKKNGKTS